MEALNRGKKLPPTPESVAELKRQSAKLEQVGATMRYRDRMLMDMIRGAIQKKDQMRAQIYANELARVRGVQRMISQSQLAIDCITIRLESYLDLMDVVSTLRPINQELKEVSKEVSQVMPQFTSDMEQLSQVANEALQSSSVNYSQPALDQLFTQKTQAGAEILKEVSSMIASELHSSFPEPPVSVATRAPPLRQMEAIACAGMGSRVPIQEPARQEKPQASMDWSVLPDDLVKMLDQLNEKNRVKMEESVA
jgi:division protein CdvB (Snf7/Vps24/ESCRT-III family)